MRLFALVAVISSSLPAFACINGMREEDTAKAEAEQLLAKAADRFDHRDFTASLSFARQALESRAAGPPTRRQARRLIGKSQLRLGHFADAKKTLLQCLDESGSPDDPGLLARIGEAEVALGKTAEGRARLEKLAEADLLPDADARVALASARFSAGETVGAYAAVKEALDQEPAHTGALALKKLLDQKSGGQQAAGPPRS